MAQAEEYLAERLYVVGKVEAIFFQNPSNFYKVILIQVTETNSDYLEKEVVITGSFGQIQEEESYRFFGHFVEHPRYGRQFQVESYQQEQPTSKNGVISYLASDKFPGIGKKTAEKIVERLGEDAIDQILETPSVLETIPHLTAEKRATLLETLRLNHGMDQVIIGLSRYGFGNQLAFAIYQAYKNETLTILKENPYQLVEEIEGVGFKRADTIAEQLGIAADAQQRIRAAIMHELFQQSMQTGNTFFPADQLLENTVKLLEASRPVEIAYDQVAEEIIHLVAAGKIQQDETRLFENSLYFSEWGIARSLQRLLSRKKAIHYPKKDLANALDLAEQTQAINYGASQKAAIEAALQSPLFILTGGPGTGKTTVINGIVTAFAELNGLSLDVKDYTNKIFPILLAAPTGRAAKRMNEATGLPASTIHRLLGLSGREKAGVHTTKELEGGLLIVDELSMVDTWLANTLFKAIPSNMQVILVGDKDQLPSVGPGQVLNDLLKIEALPQCELTEIYRQGDGSSIIPLAHEIKEGRLPADFTQNQKDRSFFACYANQIESYIRQIVLKAQSKGFTAQDIQLLAPMYRGSAGINALNKMMQEIFNPPAPRRKEVQWNETVYRIGDKVLQLVNTPELNVFNGDMGEIVGINLAKETEEKVDELIIQFDANEVTYKRNEWNKITLSYCCSIHKAQGSEFKMVILPMVRGYGRMLQRNLFYTAVTRSKELLILLGEMTAFEACVTHEGLTRQTMLTSRVEEVDALSPAQLEQINAYEETLVQLDPFEDAESEPRVKTQAAEVPAEPTEPQKKAPSLTAPKAQAISLFEERGEPDSSDALAGEPNDSSPDTSPASPVDYRLTLSLIEQQTIDPMIGMHAVTPQQFMPANES